MLERSKIQGFTETFNRQSETAWLLGDSEIERRLGRRLGDAVNLDVSLSERFQVAAYGPGGEYVAHYDSLSKGQRFVPSSVSGLARNQSMRYLIGSGQKRAEWLILRSALNCITSVISCFYDEFEYSL
ncbi:hypothetical protein J6590_064675 [Homalodisca vitripennis]|nr:hypothetical protein J6590_064675 [Homalodisca vitripennis]